MKSLSRLVHSYSFLRLTHPSYKSLTSTETSQDQHKTTHDMQIQELASGILSLRGRERKYLDWKLKEQAVKSGSTFFQESLDVSEVDPTIDSRSYFVQQDYLDEEWKEPFSVVNAIFRSGANSASKAATTEVKKKEIYDVELTAVIAADKIKIIKVIREVMSLGLKEAKELVEKTPVVLKQAKKEEADALAEKLIAAGCNITVK